MARTSLLHTCLRVAIATRLVLAATTGCYWPDGNDTGDDQKPCSSSGDSACCPDKWTCLDNGLCHYNPDDNTNLFGRYGCTDSKWEADECPSNMCTYDMTAYGGESITQCSDHNNEWCCNADAQHVNCCAESPVARPFFSLADGKAYATIGASSASSAPNLATITGIATSASGGSSPSSTAGPSSSGGSATATKDDKSTTITAASTDSTATAARTTLQTSVSSGSAGVSTLVLTSIIAPAQTSGSSGSSSSSSSSSSSKSTSNLGVIIGCAVGIPLALALLAIVFWLLRKRHNQRKAGTTSTPDPYANGDASPDFAGGAKLGKSYKSEEDVPELAGQGVGPGRPVSNVKGRAELESGGHFAETNQRVPFAPGLVGVGGGNLPSGNTHAHANANANQESWGSAPPGYSPGANAGQWGVNGVVEAPDTSVGSRTRPGTGTGANLPPNMVEAPEHGSSPGEGGHGMQSQSQTQGGRYIPYRPPPGQT
ncbi:hypothetical protein K491DRAFT_673027 [Lophiostoma macrostomum CBS 122681]|uniref:Mid2 domain-containing protein n=1 Tax=Lophiostoma macrostomum CBS 122681 TaxID=1314788 RepID=A0A6A6TSS5_9PLEO|nr:hypothetical protein K491DRAFT_673027 [Lophiostoma macrostomum CBS 122681]